MTWGLSHFQQPEAMNKFPQIQDSKSKSSTRLMEKLTIWIYEYHFIFNWNELVWILLTTLELTVQKWHKHLKPRPSNSFQFHDPHGLARDPYIGVDLFQNSEDADLVRLHALLLPLLLFLIFGSSGDMGFLSAGAFTAFFSSAGFFSAMGAIAIRRDKLDFGKGNWEIWIAAIWNSGFWLTGCISRGLSRRWRKRERKQ